MNINHMDARALAQPGGLYASANDGILQALQAYFQFKDRQQASERDMRRDERTMGRQQLNDALSQAERYGVRPMPDQMGWTDPAKADPLLSAAVQKFTVAEGRAAREREMAALRDSVMRIQAAEKLGPQGLTAGASLAEIQAAQRAAQERALAEKRQGVSDQMSAVRLKAAQDEATWNAPVVRAGRGVAEWVGDTVQEAVKAAGRKSEKPTEWRPFGDSGMVGMRLEDGYTAVRFPGSETPAQYLTPDGGMMTAEQYQKMKASLGHAVGASVQPGVDSGAPAASVPAVPGQPMSNDQLIAVARELPAPSADVLARNASADYDSVNRRGVTDAITPQEVRALAERMRMRKSQPTQHAQSNIKPTDTASEMIAAYMAQHGGTAEAARAALKGHGLIR